MTAVVIPPPLKPGARVHVVAPSSPFDVDAVRQGMAWLAGRYHVSHAPDLFDRQEGFLAGSDDQRRQELQDALTTPDVDAVVAARGGYGLTRILDDLDWAPFLEKPRWIVGFSDITALHCAAIARGVASLHAMNVARLGRADDDQRQRWLQALESPLSPRAWDNLACLSSGMAEGILFGGNLTLLFTLAAAGRLKPPEEALWVLEDVSETSYRLDRMLTALHSAGHLSRASGFVLGDFVDCSSGKYGVPTEVVLRQCLGRYSVPVLAGLPVGHGTRNDPLPLGLRGRVEAPASPTRGGRLEILPGS